MLSAEMLFHILDPLELKFEAILVFAPIRLVKWTGEMKLTFVASVALLRTPFIVANVRCIVAISPAHTGFETVLLQYRWEGVRSGASAGLWLGPNLTNIYGMRSSDHYLIGAG